MKLYFLGTGTSQGIPVIGSTHFVCLSDDAKDKRLRVSVWIHDEDFSVVIDCGPDFRQQMLRAGVKHLDAVVFTHEHKDHTAGLDDVRAYNFFQKRDMPVYGRDQVLEQIKREFAYAFAEIRYPGIPQINLCPIENQPFEIEGVNFLPIEVLHYKLPVFGYRIGDFAYITDVNYISAHELAKVKGVKVLVLGALRREKHLSHFSLSEAIEVFEKVKPEMGYITHISHQMGMHSDVEEELPTNIRLAYDGLSLVL